jgi:hypothetical protein
MNAVIEISLCLLAWVIALIRLPSILRSKAWRSDRIAFRIWVAAFFFALTMTFLVTSIGDGINNITLPNLSRLLAYSSVSMTLYLVASSFMVTFPTAKNNRQLPYLGPYLLLTLGLLVAIYIFFVSRSPRWQDAPIPSTLGEMLFKTAIFSYATIFCIVMALACYRYLSQEMVAITKFRIVAIILTATGGAAYFFTKLILTLGYIWSPLGAPFIHLLSTLLEVITAMLWVGSFLHNNVYTRVLAFLRGARYWPVYRDLTFLVNTLDRLCPPVALHEEKPSLGKYLRNSEYYLYRATIRIFDGKTFIEDLFNQEAGEDLPEWWNEHSHQEANHVYQVLKSIYASGDFWDIVRSFRIASRNLSRSRFYGKQEALFWRPQS